MSKYADELDMMYKDTNAVARATKDVIKKGGKLAFEQYYEAKSLKKLKKYIRNK